MNHNRNKKEKKERIKNLDCNIVDTMKGLRETYADLIKKHPFIWKTMIDTVCPDYIHKDIEKVALTSKYKKKNYPKIVRTFSKDTIVKT